MSPNEILSLLVNPGLNLKLNSAGGAGVVQACRLVGDQEEGDNVLTGGKNPTWDHTSYLSFFLHWQIFWKIKFTPKNANFSR